MQADTGKRSLNDVGEAAARLRQLADNVNREWQGHITDVARFRSSSIAASDAMLKGYSDPILDVLSFADLLVAAALDHADALSHWGEGAARGESTPVWAPWSVARSLVEVCAVTRWLAETPLAARERVNRMLDISARDSKTMIGLGQDESAKLEQARADAERLGVHLRNVPGHTALVRALFSDIERLNAYSMLSAASHGEPWAITAFGYEAEDTQRSDGTYLASKKPPAFFLWTALVLATIALGEASRTVALYRGWRAR